jgi:4,5-DOPA dioxygenase extradiol
MASQRMPALFLSHGSPMLAIADSAARRFLSELGTRLPPPAAVAIFSAHHDERPTQITGAERPPTIHDFGGFPRELYEIVYRAPGNPKLAERIRARLAENEIDARVDPRRGFDHGAWIPMLLMYPAADVPVLQVSIDSSRTPHEHVALGRALRALRDEGVLLIGSGGATHNLGLYAYGAGRGDTAPPPEWVERFNEWVADAIAGHRYGDLERYRAIAPFAVENHPTPEHLLPLFATLGTALDDESGERIHASYDRGLLSLDAYAFGLDRGFARVSTAGRSGAFVGLG